ncbi:hypothetical protein [Cohnella algarum]|uniref:hypothetical protein n=1 Tax=Cohnella algarum TaxID=2044859 RepID=UPI00196825BF|nr:hypothetical protein [Cohnella algarum]MBN2982769.1 hypothetical protein [Cohnella algarum]
MAPAESTSVTRCSLVVRPIDVWTGKAAASPSVRVSLAETDRKPIRTSDGSFAFVDVEPRRCTIVIRSSTYLEFSETADLSLLPPAAPIVLACLLPNRLHPAPPAGTGLVFRITDKLGTPLAGVSVSAYVDEESAVRGRVAEEEAPKGASALRYVPGNGRFAEGDTIVLRGRDGEAAEWSKVRDCGGNEFALSLVSPLERSWERGARLLPGVMTRSDRDGTVVLPFRGTLPAACRIRAELRYGGRTVSAVWTAEGGRVALLGPFVWP